MREKDNVVYEEYSADKQYRYQVCEEEKYYSVYLDKRITDEYMGPDWFAYHPVSGDYHKHITDDLETAKLIGREGLRNLTGKSPL